MEPPEGNPSYWMTSCRKSPRVYIGVHDQWLSYRLGQPRENCGEEDQHYQSRHYYFTYCLESLDLRKQQLYRDTTSVCQLLKMDYSSIIAVLVALLWGAATAAPSRLRRDATTLTVSTPRWHQPCAGKTPAESTDLGGIIPAITTPEFNATSAYQQIQEHAIVSRGATERLITNITVQRIKFDYERDARDMRLVGLPIIPTVNQTQDVAALLQNTYEWLMRFAVYLEAMGIDESIERRTHISFHKEVKELEDNFVYWLLCKLKSTMQGHGMAPNARVGRDILETYHATESRAVRHLRGFLILRDLRDALRYIEAAFDVILSRTMDTPST